MKDNELLILLKMCWNASKVALEASVWVLHEWVASHQWANIMLIILCSRCWTLDVISTFIWIDFKSSFFLSHFHVRFLDFYLSFSPSLPIAYSLRLFDSRNGLFYVIQSAHRNRWFVTISISSECLQIRWWHLITLIRRSHFSEGTSDWKPLSSTERCFRGVGVFC